MLSSLLGLCLLLPVLMRFAAPLCIFVLLRLKGRTKEVEMITEEIHLLKQEQSQVSMMDEFAKHAKLGRKINTKTKALKKINEDNDWTRMKGYWYSKIGLYILSALIVIVYCNEPVIFFDISEYADNTLIYMMAYLISFPSGIIGAIGMPLGVFICNRMISCAITFIESRFRAPKRLVFEPVE